MNNFYVIKLASGRYYDYADPIAGPMFCNEIVDAKKFRDRAAAVTVCYLLNFLKLSADIQFIKKF